MEYQLFEFGLACYRCDATRRDATQAHEKVVNGRFERIRQLRSLLATEGIDLSLHPSALQPLNDWFVTQVEMRDRTERERREDRQAVLDRALRHGVEPGDDPAPVQRPSRRTESLIVDTMLFIGEVLVTEAPHLFWELMTAKRDYAYQRTVLAGFRNVQRRNYYVDLEGVLRSYAYAVASGEPRVVRPTRDYGEGFWNVNKFVHLHDSCLQIA